MSSKIKIAAVLPRFGATLGGGAETLVRSLLLELRSRGEVLAKEIDQIEVWTTCAKDHRTWANELPSGMTLEDGIVVRRFPVDERDLPCFVEKEIAISKGIVLSVEEQLQWLKSGVNSMELYQHIADCGQDFDYILFAPYLFPTSFWGALIYPERSIVFPCLHDEAYAYQDVFEYLFRKVRGVIFNATGERELFKKLYRIPDISSKSGVVGMGFCERIHKEGALIESQELATKPYIIYSGRKEQGKNLDLLIEYFSAYKTLRFESALQLVIIGAGEINFLDKLPEFVLDLGFVSEERKYDLLRNALCLCQPSVNESFSIVMMEAWLEGVPVLVNSHSVVTKGHVIESSGGLYFGNFEEFVAVLDELQKNSELARTLGESGEAYVKTQYNWDATITRFEQVLTNL